MTSVIRKLDDPEYLACRRGNQSLIYAPWHNVQVFLAYTHRGERASVLVSQSKDGEYIVQIMKRLHLQAVRGSSSRGGGSALRDMIHQVHAGGRVGFTLDGPKGPLQTVHGGVVEVARSSGRPIIPVSILSRRKIVFSNTWDQFFVPLPFSTIVVAHGKPLFISKDLPMEDAQSLVQEELNKIRDATLRTLEEAPSYASSLCVALLAPAAALAAAIKTLWRWLSPRHTPKSLARKSR